MYIIRCHVCHGAYIPLTTVQQPLCPFVLINSYRAYRGCLGAAVVTLFMVIMLGMQWVCMSFALKEKHCICFCEFYGYAMHTYYSIYPYMIINLVLV